MPRIELNKNNLSSESRPSSQPHEKEQVATPNQLEWGQQ